MTAQERDERFRLLVEGVKDYAIFMLDPDGHVASWNSGAERIKGYPAQEIIGQHFACFYTAEDVARGKPAEELAAAAAQGRYEEDGWRVRKDGSRFRASIVITALRDDEGRLRGFAKVASVANQIAVGIERKRTEEMLLIGEDVSLTTMLDPELRQVRVDPSQIEQVIMNLAVNARDAMQEGGHLTLETGNVVLDESYTREHPYVQPGNYVLLAMTDTGCGMDQATQARIFEPFFTTKEKGRGTGLGMATVYGIVKQSGGHVGLYSEPGQGTTFKIYLPALDEAVEAGGPEKAPTGATRGTETVLLVEDEDALRVLARHILQSQGYHVLEASRGDEAIYVSDGHKGPIHILVTDVVMPVIGGRQLAERLVVVRPDLKVLFMSGYTDDAVVRHGILEAKADFLQKPFTPGSLARKVREVLDR